MSSTLYQSLKCLLADTYAVYLKTQNYHWHVTGPDFYNTHMLLEKHYMNLANAVDDLAERIITIGHLAPASFEEYSELTSIKSGNPKASSKQMLTELHDDHQQIIDDLYKVLKLSEGDEGTVSLLSARIEEHEKMRWMLGASIK